MRRGIAAARILPSPRLRGAEPDHDPPDSRNHMAKPYDDALIGHLAQQPTKE